MHTCHHRGAAPCQMGGMGLDSLVSSSLGGEALQPTCALSFTAGRSSNKAVPSAGVTSPVAPGPFSNLAPRMARLLGGAHPQIIPQRRGSTSPHLPMRICPAIRSSRAYNTLKTADFTFGVSFATYDIKLHTSFVIHVKASLQLF